MQNRPELQTRTIIDILSKGRMSIEDIEKQISYYDRLGGILLTEMGKADMTVDNLSGFSAVNRNTIYKTLNGKMLPERNTILRWAFVMHMTIERTDVMLKASTRGGLSAHVKRDLLIMNGLAQKYDLWDMDAELRENGFQPLLRDDDLSDLKK